MEEQEEEEEEEQREADRPEQIECSECSMKDKVLYCCDCEGHSVTQHTRGPQKVRVLWCQCPLSPPPQPWPIVISGFFGFF